MRSSFIKSKTYSDYLVSNNPNKVFSLDEINEGIGLFDVNAKEPPQVKIKLFAWGRGATLYYGNINYSLNTQWLKITFNLLTLPPRRGNGFTVHSQFQLASFNLLDYNTSSELYRQITHSIYNKLKNCYNDNLISINKTELYNYICEGINPNILDKINPDTLMAE